MLRLAPLFCLLISFVTVNRTYAQDPVPFPTQNAVWHEDFISWGYYYQRPPLGTAGDTLINDTTYTQIRSSASLETFEVEGSEFVMGIYSEDRRQYAYVPDLGHSRLLYDFNLAEGDSFQYRNPLTPFFGYDITYIVLEQDSLLINGIYHKTLTIGPEDWWDTMTWIEGIGSNVGLWGVEDLVFDIGNKLVCHYQNDELVYTPILLWEASDSNGDCTLDGEVSVPEILLDNSISLSPNPTNHSLTIQFKEQTLGPQEIQIIDYSGRVVKRQVVQSQNTIDVSELSQGIYVVITEDGQSTRFIKL